VFSEVLRCLDENQIPYMVVGSIASIVYGETRLTKDMDLVVDIPPAVIRNLATIFPTPEYYCPPLEVLQDEHLRRGQFNILHPASGLKVDFVFRKPTPHGEMEFSRRKQIELWPGLQVFIASPEDVIIKKLEYFKEGGSPKHLMDIRGILAITDLDRSYLEEWVTKLGLATEWSLAHK
jgi:hypothetical protein